MAERSFDSEQLETSESRFAAGAALVGAGAALAFLFWLLGRRVPRRRERASICVVDEWETVRIKLKANGDVKYYDPTVTIKIPKGDRRVYGIEWVVDNIPSSARRGVHIANVRRGSKAGGRKDIFEPGSDRAEIRGGREEYFVSCLSPDVEDGRYFYDIRVDETVRVDPEIVIIRR